MPTQSRPSPKTPHERAQEKYKAKLELVREQVESGSLVIRQMTDEERDRYTTPSPPQVAPVAVIDGRA